MKYRKKPVVIDAWKYDGNVQNSPDWLNCDHVENHYPTTADASQGEKPYMTIGTLEGVMTAEIGDYIIQGVKGELYPCKPDIFEATYDLETEPLPVEDLCKSKEDQGLYEKFEVYRTDGKDQLGEKHDGCVYFVIDLTHDKHGAAAIRAYAEACQNELPHLASDLMDRATHLDALNET